MIVCTSIRLPIFWLWTVTTANALSVPLKPLFPRPALRQCLTGGHRLLVAAQAVRTAYGAVAKLTPKQKWQLGRIITGLNARPYWLPVDLPSEAEDNLAPALIEAVDAAFGTFIERGPHAASGKKGKQKGTKAQWAMHDFVLRLWDWSRQWGAVTLSSKGGQAGDSIVEMLGILKPMLPKQFFPGILSHSFLRKVQKSLPVNPAAELAKKLRRLRSARVSLFGLNRYINPSREMVLSSLRRPFDDGPT